MLDVTGSVDVKTEDKPARSGRGRPAKKSAERGRTRGGVTIPARLSHRGISPFDEIEWDRRTASINDDRGNAIFSQPNVEVPKSWSMLATNVVASKYFYGPVGSETREHSARQLVHRVARTISDWGLSGGYFATPEDAETFYNELCAACINQYGSFNSPVWFNVGLHQVYGYSAGSRSSHAWNDEAGRVEGVDDSYRHPQASACFIQSVGDSMEDIMRLAAAEAMLFKHGSGTGTDLSTLRSTREKLSGGGTPSGPISFMRVYDQVAAVIKSGGKTHRAAKMQSLKVSHPDILDFVTCKIKEEKKAWALIEQGYDGTFGGEAYDSVMFQNANLSVRVTDEFMQAVEADGDWTTHGVTTGEPLSTFRARELMKQMAEGAHLCGDPGMQYDTTINRWHTCANSGPINASNPCSEYMFLDDSACNLASINLMKFVDEAGTFDVETFRHVVRLFIVAQEILVDSASYPTDRIALTSHRFRPLGLGYANLGALIMRLGFPYDSDQGRAFAGLVTAVMTGNAYATSQELAGVKGPFDGYDENADSMQKVMRMHRQALEGVGLAGSLAGLRREAVRVWEQVVETGPETGFRNAQVTVLAPTGTIGFMMDCDTTGVEPDIALVKYKQLAGGGMMKIVNRSLEPALNTLGYSEAEAGAIGAYVEEKDTIENAPHLKPQHLPVFDCAFKPKNGTRSIPYRAHLRMMAAVQPFLSGAISKTVNLPAEATVDDIMQTFLEGWKLGLKAVAVYRDGSKRVQPLSTSKAGPSKGVAAPKEVGTAAAAPMRGGPMRRRLPATRQSITHKFEVAGHEGYLTVGIYEDGAPGELFITMAKEGSTVGGTMDAFGTALSLCLQYGVPVRELCQKFAHSRFEPSGFTKNPDIPIAKSIVDYIFRWLDQTFPNGKVVPAMRVGGGAADEDADATTEAKVSASAVSRRDVPPVGGAAGERIDAQFNHFMADAPACDVCGSITVRNGACYRCFNCGNSMGCS